GPHLPPLSPPSADLRAPLRLLGALHAAALARRGGARERLPVRANARRPLAEARESEMSVRLDVGAPGKEAALHGRGVRSAFRVAPRPEPGLAPSARSRSPRHPAPG